MMRRREFLGTTSATAAALGMAPGPRAASPARFAPRGLRQVCDLNGTWDFRLDERDRGITQRWFERPPAASEAASIAAAVPAVWQRFVDISGGIGWYYREIDLPAALLAGALRLRFHAVDYRARVWWNGREAGSHEGGHTPFDIDVARLARQGANLLAVRVSDPPRTFRRGYAGLPGWEKTAVGGVDGLHFDDITLGFQDWREGLNYGGIWQPVELIASDRVYVADIFVQAKLDGSGEALIEIANTAGRELPAAVTLEITSWNGAGAAGGGEAQAHLAPGSNTIAIPFQVAQAKLWSPDQPALYAARVAVREGGNARDGAEARFGIREFAVDREGAFTLNGKQIFVKGAHFQGNDAVTIAWPRSEESARQVVAIAREGGFNFMRFQGRPMPPPILDAADELGILVQAEPALRKFNGTPALEPLALREVSDLVRRDRNRPSVVIWNMVNEQAVGMRAVEAMCRRVRELDPTRLITESAGGNSHYYPAGSAEGVPYLTEHYYAGAPLTAAMLDYFRARGTPGRLYFVSEFGYGGLEDVDSVLARYGDQGDPRMEDYYAFVRQKQEIEEAFATTEAKDIFPDLAAFREASQALQANTIRLHVEAMRSNPRLRGYNIVQLFDSNGNEVDGLVDFWKDKRKKSFYTMRELNGPLLLLVRATPLNARVGGEVQVAVTLVNEDKISGTKTLRIRAVDGGGRMLAQREQAVEARPWVTELWSGGMPAGDHPGEVRIEAELRDGDSVVLRRSAAIDVYHAGGFRWPERGFAVFDPQRHWPGARRIPAVREYDPAANRAELVAVPAFSGLWREAREFDRFLLLADQAARGSTVLFLGVPSDGPPPAGITMHYHAALFPLTLASALQFVFSVSEERGGWGKPVSPYGWAAGDARAGCPITRHPVFEGCPGPGLADAPYGNLVPLAVVQSLRAPSENTGPGIQVVPYSSGRVVFCTWRLLENLDTDMLAGKLLSNLVGWLAAGIPAELRPATAREEEFLRFRRAQAGECRARHIGTSA